MKITIFDGSFKTTAFIRRLMQGLVKAGLQVSVIGFNEENPNPVPGVTYVSLGSNQNKLGFIKTSIGLAIKTGSLPKIATTLKLLAKGKRKALQKQNVDVVLQNLQPDIVHLQWPSLLPWIQPYFNKEAIKIVLSQRGFHTNVRPFIDEENFDYLRRMYPKLDGIHSVSKAISTVGKEIGVPKTGIDEVVYTGLDLEKIDFQEKPEHNTSKLELLSVGRPHWKKDYPTAIKACAILKEQGLDFHYTIIGGEGDEESLFLIHELGLEQHISLTGKLPQKEVFKRMQEANLVLLPSIEEGIANVVVEAMALGTPVISTNCGGMEELIKDGEEGWVVPTRNPEALAEAVQKFTTLKELKTKEVTVAARKKIEGQHSEGKMIADMIGLYKAVIKA